ncbi:MAG: hypothetical protein ACXWDN_01375 [Limisphaerales bacterium]
MSTSTPAASPYKSAVRSAVVQQVIVLVLASMILDGGDILTFCLVACLAFWVGFAFIRVRRGRMPTKIDLTLIRGSYLLLCLITYAVVYLVWKSKGLI